MGISPDKLARIKDLLGREPRGLEDVVVEGEGGEPVVIRVASLVDNKPFPTLFWLVEARLCYRIDQLEASGVISKLQQRIDGDRGLRSSMVEDHRAHITLRRNYMSQDDYRRLQELGYDDVLASKGIGGIADFSRIRCLHTWYAAHLVVPNTVGALVDDWWTRKSPKS